MSAICGIFSLNQNTISLENSNNMMEKLKFYTFDYINTLSNDKVFLGCGIQYITPESKLEKLPFYDEKNLLSITADAIIDNREELFSVFNVLEELWNETTDSDLILRSYIKWGKECPIYLVGDFSFAIWDENKKELFCARDHTGTRTFYYYSSKETFAFCTVIKPLFTVIDHEIELNEKWITDYLALPLTLHQCECSETIYEGIYELPPATSMIINTQGISLNKFWNPLNNIKPLKLKDDKAYVDAFRKVFFEAVRCRLRTTGEVGISLSGGMDSGSVACVAAMELQKKEKKLMAFSSIPMKGYKGNKAKYYIVDESEYIEKIKEKYENIQLSYCRNEGQNALTNINWILDVIEQPYKIVENMVWCNGIIEEASKQDCKVMLSGQFGNFTISYGDFESNILTLFRKKRLIKMIKEINMTGQIYKINRKKLAKAVLNIIQPYSLRKILSLKVYKNANEFDSNLANEKLVSKWDVKKRFSKYRFYNEVSRYNDNNENQKNSMKPLGFSQMGLIETKIGLSHGIVERDPTRDKRVIEFCFSLPMDQFVKNGEDRRLIRKAMEGMLPDKIRLNKSTKGLQSADWIQRLEVDWEKTYTRFKKMSNNTKLLSYIDKDKLKKDLLLVGGVFNENNALEIRRLIVALVFAEFLKN